MEEIMSVTVKTIDLNDKKGIETFLHLPWKIYAASQAKRDPNWVPPFLPDQRGLLDPHKNPFHDHAKVALFAAYNERGEIVGRISASVDDNYIRHWNEKTGHFGWFECIQDVSTAQALFREAEKFLKSNGITKVLGPASFSS